MTASRSLLEASAGSSSLSKRRSASASSSKCLHSTCPRPGSSTLNMWTSSKVSSAHPSSSSPGVLSKSISSLHVGSALERGTPSMSTSSSAARASLLLSSPSPVTLSKSELYAPSSCSGVGGGCTPPAFARWPSDAAIEPCAPGETVELELAVAPSGSQLVAMPPTSTPIPRRGRIASGEESITLSMPAPTFQASPRPPDMPTEPFGKPYSPCAIRGGAVAQHKPSPAACAGGRSNAVLSMEVIPKASPPSPPPSCNAPSNIAAMAAALPEQLWEPGCEPPPVLEDRHAVAAVFAAAREDTSARAAMAVPSTGAAAAAPSNELKKAWKGSLNKGLRNRSRFEGLSWGFLASKASTVPLSSRLYPGGACTGGACKTAFTTAA
mmetsp:Transcript_113847/g.327147  ORF Transcript_113847/g.327147 Transcript_113847/m.327147 type:complete len:381 (-) Transcript_113847:829-1971(-)